MSGSVSAGGRISIHALRVEGDTLFASDTPAGNAYFYPRPPGGGRPHKCYHIVTRQTISIHALRVEGDPMTLSHGLRLTIFLSTPSGWRATLLDIRHSIPSIEYFYPRPPGGGRLEPCISTDYATAFLSTPSGWRATWTMQRERRAPCDFYPRPPGGGRLRRLQKEPEPGRFLSTPSGWRATVQGRL